jgi:hypothetical protein
MKGDLFFLFFSRDYLIKLSLYLSRGMIDDCWREQELKAAVETMFELLILLADNF